MEWIKDLLRKPAGKIVACVLAVLVLWIFVVQVRSFFGPQVPADMLDPWFVCAQTGKGFHHKLVAGERYPVYSPYSGANTGYPAELCYWNADGSIRKEPTEVLLNEYIGQSGPTFCPDCGRLVVGHNPLAKPGAKPPPTRQEYERMHAANGE